MASRRKVEDIETTHSHSACLIKADRIQIARAPIEHEIRTNKARQAPWPVIINGRSSCED